MYQYLVGDKIHVFSNSKEFSDKKWGFAPVCNLKLRLTGKFLEGIVFLKAFWTRCPLPKSELSKCN